MTAALMRHWKITDSLPNPPRANRFSTNIAHFRQYAMDMAYVAPWSDGIRQNVQTSHIRCTADHNSGEGRHYRNENLS